MRKRLTSMLLALALIVPALVALTATPAVAFTMSNTNSIALRDPNFAGNPNCSNPSVLCNATAATYPSTIAVTGQTGTISSLSVSLNNVSYAFSEDISALLVGPGGQSLILVSAVGPNCDPCSTAAASNSTLTISDSGTLPTDTTAWGSAPTFKPANFGSYGLGDTANGFNEDYTSPAPAAPWGDPGQHGTNATLGNTFDGLSANGTWSLYVITTQAGDDTGAIAGGWTLNLTTAATAAPTTTTLSSNTNPSFTSGGSSLVTLTATVSSTSTVSAGTVDFTDGGVTISGCGAVAVSAGTASCTTTFTTEGNHSLEALYSGTANFGASNGTLTQQVNDHTTVTGSSYCNTGSITLNNPPDTVADASPYPSRVFVTSLGGDVSHLTVSLNGVTYSQSQDIDALLVGPGGQSLILVSDAGPNSGGAISNVTLTLDDAAATTLAQTAIWGSPSSSVTSKPVNFGGVNETWGAPAPAGPYGNPGPSGGGTATLGSVFNGTNPVGTWSLYLITTAAGDGTGSVSGGWCANITTNNVTSTTTAIASSNNPSFTSAPGNSVTFTATVSSTSTVSEGTVDFTSNGVTIAGCGAEAVTAGTASCTTTFSAEGSDTIEALYSGDATFGASNASLIQAVNDHTTVSGNSFCNTGSITLNNPNISNPEIDASPYPSNIFVTGRPGNLLHLSVTLNNVTYPDSQDIDGLLVGPGGQTLILVAAAGPNSGGALSNVTLTLDDNAASTIPSTAAWGAASSTVTSKPVNYGGDNEIWGPPAPAGPYGNPGPFGGGTATLGSTYDGASPNGTWSLYLITTAAGDGTGAVGGGWCLGITTPAPPTLTKAFGATTIPLNGSTSLSFTVTNPNAASSLSGIGFTDTLPSGLTLATPADESGTCGGGTITAPSGGTTVSLSGASLADSATCSFFVNVTGITAGSQVNITSAPTSTEGGSGTAATATLVVVAPPTLTKAFGAPSVALNGSTSLSFTVTNPNASTSLSGIGFSDTLPSGLVVASPNGETGSCGTGTITATAAGGTIGLTGATLAGDGTCTFSVNVTATSTGSKVNTTSTITSTEGGTGTAATATLMVNSAAPTISKSFGAATVPLGGSTSLSFTITNPTGNGSSTGIAFSDTLPSGLLVSSPNGLSGTCGGTVTATAATGMVTLSGGTLADGANCTISLNVTGIAAGVQNNSVTVSSSNGGTGNTATASLTVVAPPSLTKAFGASMIALNGSTSLTFTVTNPNAGTTLTGIEFNDTLPTGLIVSTPNGLTNTCASSTVTFLGSTVIDFAGGTLGADATCTVSVNITGTAAGVYNNVTSIVASDNGGFGPDASASITVAAGPVMIAKSFGASTIPLGGSTTLSFTITNPSANGTSTGIAFTDTLPSGLVVSTPNGLTGTCGGGTITATAASSTVSLTGASLSAGASCTFSVSVTGTTAGVKNNAVTVSSTSGGTGNTSTASITVVAPPGLTKAFGAASVPLNGSTTLSFTVSNPNATVSLSGVAFTDTLPSGLVVSTPNGLTGSCGGGTITATAASSTVSLSGAALGPAGSCTFTVNVTGTAAGSQVNTTGAVTSNEGGTGSTATATLTVVAPPVIAKSFGAANIALNGTTSLIITITNPAANTVPLVGVAFTDTLPAGLVVATPNILSTSCGGSITATPASGSVSLSGVTLATSSSCTVSLNVTATTSGAKNNSVSVTSTNGGTGNTATATVFVASPVLIAKSFGASTIALNGSTTLSFTITNPAGNGSSTGIAFSDSFPSGLVVSTPNGLTGTCGGGTITATAASTSVSLSGATLADGGACTFSVNVTGTTAGVKNNSVTVTSTNGGTGNTATASVTVVAPPTLSKSFGASSVPLGGSTSLTFTAANPNSTVSLSGIAFSDTLPSGLVVSTPNGLTGSCGGGTITATAGSTSVSLSGATLAASASCTFSVNVTGIAAGTEVNTTGAVTSTNGGTGGTATATLVVVAPPVIAKSFSPGDVALNGTSTLTFTLTNPAANTDAVNGPEKGVGFTDTFPSGMVIATPSGAASTCADAAIMANAGSTTVTASGILIPIGGSCTITVSVEGTTAGALVNSVTISSTNGGTGNTAMATLDVATPPSISKSFGAATIPENGSTSLGFTITNPNSAVAVTGVAFTDTLPAGLVVSTPNGLTGTCGGGTITATAGSTSVSLSGATLGDSASCTFSVNVTGTTAGVKNNSVTVTTTNSGTGNTATASITVVAPPTLTKAFGASSVPLGGSTTLSFTVANPNATVSLTGVAFTDNLPAGIVVATPLGITTNCGGSTLATAGGTSVTLSGATLAASATCTITVSVTGTAAGSLTNTTGAISSTNGGTGATATATLVVVAPPVIAKSFGTSTVALNGTTSLTFTITNPAANTVALTGVAFTDTLPSGLVVSTPNGLTGTCGGGTITATAGSSTVSLSGAAIAAGGTCTFSVNVTGTTSGAKNNSVTVSSTNGGTGNTATATLSVASPPAITKAFGAATIPVGGSTSLTFTINNPNSAGFSLTGVGFTDTLPAGLVVSTPPGKSGTCGGGTITATKATATVSLGGATLAAGATCTFSVNVTATTAGVKNNSVTVTSTNAGSGNTATASVTVVAPPTLAKAFGVSSIPFGGSTSLTFTVSNPNATVGLSGVGFTDTLPSGLVVSTPNGLSGSCGGGTITATAGSSTVSLAGASIAASGSCTFSVTVTATSVGSKVNTTSAVTSTNGGTGLTATATVGVTRAPTTTTVTASPSSATFGSPVTFTATVVPSGPNTSGTNPTGTVSFYLNGGATPVAVVALKASTGTASFTTSGLGVGGNTVTAVYSGDTNFLPSSSSTSAMVSVTCTTTFTGNLSGLVLGPGSTCIVGAHVTGSITVPKGSSLDLENSTVTGAVSATNAVAAIRMCGSSAASVTVNNAKGFVVIGDAVDGCATNSLSGSLTLINNTHGVQAIDNFVAGTVTASGNSGAGPFPDDTAPNISGNGH